MKDLDEQKKKHSSGVLLSVTDAANNHRDYCREGLLFEAIPDKASEVLRLIPIHPASVKEY